MLDVDLLDIADFSALGPRPWLMVDAAGFQRPDAPIQSVVIGVDADGSLPAVRQADFDVLLTTAADPPAPWIGVASCAKAAAALGQRVQAFPAAATILCQTLRLVEALPFEAGLVAESLAYSTLLGGGEFKAWLAGRPAVPPLPPRGGELVRVERSDDLLTLTLDHPDTDNAMNATMRDALYTALANALADPSRPRVRLAAAGRCFSTGGHLGEFGTAGDPAQAHVVRTLHANAGLCHRLGDRLEILFDGAAIGSGLEVPAAAGRRLATAKAWFQLPELRLGLIPGAGGTVSLSRAIGRHRTAWMVLSGARVGARQALAWGLVTQLVAT